MAGSLVLQEKKISQGCRFHGYSKMNISLLFLFTNSRVEETQGQELQISNDSKKLYVVSSAFATSQNAHLSTQIF